MEDEEIKELEVVDWGHVSQQIELKRTATEECGALFFEIYSRIKGKGLVVVEVGEGISAFPVFSYLYNNLHHDKRVSGYTFPILGATTPYDLNEHKECVGNKCAAWVTESTVSEPWVAEKFTLIKPINLYEIMTFIKVATEKAQDGAIFIGDFLDEIYDIISEKEFHSLLSRLHVTVESKKATLIVVMKKELYSKEYIAMIERYADAKLAFNSEIEYTDMKTNRKESLGSTSQVLG